MSKIKSKSRPEKKGLSTTNLWIIGLIMGILGIVLGYFIWDIQSPNMAAFAFAAVALTGIPLLMAVFRCEKDICFLIIFAWLTLFFFSRFIFGGGMLFGTDTMGLGYFAHSFYRDYIREFAKYPLWEPLLHGGMPFHEAMHGDVLYPTRILELIMPLHYALGFRLVLHVFLAGFFMFGFIRKLGLSRIAGFFSGVAYMFGGFFVSYIYAGHDGKMFVICLLPLAFWALESALSDGKLWRYILFGLTYTLMILSAHMQMAYFAAWAIGAYFVFRIIRMIIQKRGIKRALVNTIFFIVVVLLAIGISALQLYPPFDYLGKYSQRTQRTEESGYEWSTSWSLHPEEIGSIVVPEFAGVNVSGLSTYWGRNAFKLNSDYFSIVILLLALGAVVLIRKPRTWFFMGVGIFSTIYALGATTPFFRIFYAIIPQVKKFRGPSMLIFLAAFSCVILAAYMIDALANEEKRKLLMNRCVNRFLIFVGALLLVVTLLFTVAGSGMMKLWNSLFYKSIDPQKISVMTANISNMKIGLWLAVIVAGGSLAFFYMGIRKKISPIIALTGIVLLVCFDLWRIDRMFVKIVDYRQYFGASGSVNWLKEEYEKQPFRVLVTPGAFQDSYLATHGLEEVVFGVGHGNQLRTFDEFIGRSTGSRKLMTQPVLALLNMDFIAIRNNQLRGFPEAYRSGGLIIYANPLSLPRAFPFYNWVEVDSPEEGRNLVFSEGFSYDRIVAVEGEVPFRPTTPADTDSVMIRKPQPAIINHENGSEFSVEVNMEHDGLLFISENWYPAWQATENGEKLEILRADGTFRAVPLAKGSHKVDFAYKSGVMKNSLLVSVGSLILSLLLLALSLISGKNK